MCKSSLYAQQKPIGNKHLLHECMQNWKRIKSMTRKFSMENNVNGDRKENGIGPKVLWLCLPIKLHHIQFELSCGTVHNVHCTYMYTIYTHVCTCSGLVYGPKLWYSNYVDKNMIVAFEFYIMDVKGEIFTKNSRFRKNLALMDKN